MFRRSEIQNQLAGLLIDVIFLPQFKLSNVPLLPLTMSSLKNMCFKNKMCAETTLGELAISLVLVISCEPVNVETESRNFSAFEAPSTLDKQGICVNTQLKSSIKQSKLYMCVPKSNSNDRYAI